MEDGVHESDSPMFSMAINFESLNIESADHLDTRVKRGTELSLEYREFCDILAEFLDISCSCDLRSILGKFQKIKPDDPLIYDKCVICLENYEQGTYKRVLKCGHAFHKKCVDRWFAKLNEYEKELTCPICRLKIK